MGEKIFLRHQQNGAFHQKQHQSKGSLENNTKQICGITWKNFMLLSGRCIIQFWQQKKERKKGK